MVWKDPNEAWFDFLGGRKFVICVVGLTYGFVLALMGKLTPEFTFVLIALTGFYSGANVLNTNAALKAGVPATGPGGSVSTSTVSESAVTRTSEINTSIVGS